MAAFQYRTVSPKLGGKKAKIGSGVSAVPTDPLLLSGKISRSLHDFSFTRSIPKERRILRDLSSVLPHCWSLSPDQVQNPSFRKLVGFAALQAGSALAAREHPPESAESLLLRGLQWVKGTKGSASWTLWGLVSLAELYLKTGQTPKARSICDSSIGLINERWATSGQLLEIFGKVLEKERNPELARRYTAAALSFYEAYIQRHPHTARSYVLFINLAQEFIDVARDTPTIPLSQYRDLVLNLEQSRQAICSTVVDRIAGLEASVLVAFAFMAEGENKEAKVKFFEIVPQLRNLISNSKTLGLTAQDQAVSVEILARCHLGLAIGEYLDHPVWSGSFAAFLANAPFSIQISTALSLFRQHRDKVGRSALLVLSEFENLLLKYGAVDLKENLRAFRGVLETKLRD